MRSWFDGQLAAIVDGVRHPWIAFAYDGGSRIFWMTLITGLAIAHMAYTRRQQQPAFFALLMSRSVWLGRSAINDYIILILGSVLRATVLAWAFINWQEIASPIIFTLQQLGVAGQMHTPPSLALAGVLTLTWAQSWQHAFNLGPALRNADCG